jgi:arylsulfatase A-like enzyme
VRHRALVLGLALLAGGGCARGARESAAAEAQRPPNVLWLLAEDMGPELGVLGTPEVRTPNLDGLARRGMLFTRAFTTAPVCSASRSAFNTGMYQTTIGAQNHRSHRPDDGTVYPVPLPEGVRTVSDWLRGAGYYTGNIVHFPEDAGFRGTGKTDWNFTVEGKPFDTDRWDDLKDHQPFYAQVNFQETHRSAHWDSAQLHVPTPADPAKVVVPPYYPDHPVVRRDWAQYLDNVMALDAHVGKILEYLARDGLAENTVVVFMPDHGRAMVRGKQWPYDSGLHVPLIVYWPAGLPAPEGFRAGGTSDRLISSIDLAATTLDLAGVRKPARMQGRVFLGPHADPPRRYLFGGRDRGDETVDRIRTVRDERYRYIRNYHPERPFFQINRYKEANYPTVWVMRKLHREGKLDSIQEHLMAPTRPAEELYDLEADPYEIHDLADSPAHREVLERLRAELDRWIAESDDQGRFPEDSAVYRYYDERAKRNWGPRIEELSREWGVPSADSMAALRRSTR